MVPRAPQQRELVLCHMETSREAWTQVAAGSCRSQQTWASSGALGSCIGKDARQHDK